MLNEKVRRLVESRGLTNFIVTLILINAVTLGLETNETVYSRFGHILVLADRTILGIFVIEILLKLFVYRLSFFKSGWNVFDFLIVGISLLPATGPLAILRAFRIFRVLRLFSIVPQMRLVITGLLRALPGMASVVGVIMIVFYISAVLVTKIFGNTDNPDLERLFDSLPHSMLTLFQLMTLEDWFGGIVGPAMEVYPMAWLFFIPFIIITSFAVLNLFIGVIVESMQSVHAEEQRKMAPNDPDKEVTLDDIQKEIRALREDIANLRK